MELFNIDFGTFIIRFYIMMAIVVGAFFAGVPLLAFLAFPILLGNMLGIKFNGKKKKHQLI
ncbi:MAG: hypothetical protein ACJA01_002606 [Saprospiraceae bacterium]|jgi:hypothetical protein